MAIAAVLAFLWNADAMGLGEAAIWCAAIASGLWATGHCMQGKLSMLEVLAVECAALATVSALAMIDGYWVFKPMTMTIAIVFVAVRAYSAGAIAKFDLLLIAALVFSL